MRKKLPNNEKRNSPIGIKVKSETRKQLDYISKAEGHTLSTYIDIILKEHIDQYFKKNNIEWENLPEDEKKGGE